MRVKSDPVRDGRIEKSVVLLVRVLHGEVIATTLEVFPVTRLLPCGEVYLMSNKTHTIHVLYNV